jgi:6-pyruvoyltetrahydropterin/6-carboxytetrahydropterin synthase
MLRITRTVHFSSSLRYRLEDLSEEENLKRFCAESRQHGHNYQLDITVRGTPDPETGMVMNLADLKAIAEREIMARFDHRDLNDDSDFFHSRPPTPEHFAQVIFRLLDAALPPGRLDRIRLHAAPDLFVDVIGPAA